MSLELMKSLYKMQQKQELTDCCFSFDADHMETNHEKAEQKFIYAHKVVLSAASPVFKTMMSDIWSNNEVIDMTDTSYHAFKILIKAIYTGNLELEKVQETLEVYSLAHLYQVSEVIRLASAYMIKLSKYSPEVTIPFLNHACLYENQPLKEACLKLVQEKPVDILRAESFLTASPEVVKLIFSLNSLNVPSDSHLVQAMQRYLESHPDLRPDLEDAIYAIRFLTLEDDEILECGFLDLETKDRLIILKNNPNLPINILTPFTQNRQKRANFKLLPMLPSNVVLRMFELYNDRHCFLCQEAHSALSCHLVWKMFKPFTYLNRIYLNNYSHTCLERYSNEHITAILQAFKKLASDERENSRFADFLDL
ncbi:kelch-like protein 40a [Culicoides brevitarsis]|uniref:kelch-like protein 40a n=1 Tax=Culicoides brevitarsis TaxID=469753 RepID=UPI00307B98F7